MDQKASGSFSCDATTPTGNNPYYQITNPAPNPGFQPLECEGLVASSSVPYYALTSGAIGAANPALPTPYPGAVPNPGLDQVISKAFLVGRYGNAESVTSGTSGYGVSALQYAKNSSYFVQGNDPNLNPPSGPPTVPSLAAPATGDTIPIIFDTAGISGSEPLVFTLSYGVTATPNASWTTIPTFRVISTNQPTTQFVANATGLQQGTKYYFVSRASNTQGAETSAVASFTTASTPSAPTAAPTIPVYVSATNTSITVQYDAAGITGNPVPTYFVRYGTTTTPTTPVALSTLISGTIYQATATGLTAGVNYYFVAVSTNSIGQQVSAVSAPMQTGSNNSPSAAPPAPVVSGTPTTTSITVSVDITGITGTPTPTYTLAYGTTTACTQNGGTMSVTGNTATATVSGLTAATNYYFQATAQNGVPTNKTGPVSAPIPTAGSSGTAPSGNAAAFILTLNNIVSPNPSNTSISFLCDPSSVTGSPTPQFKVLYGLLSNPSTDPNAISFPFSAYPILPAITGLNPNTTYYFQAVAYNGVSPDFASDVRSYKTTGSGGNTPPNQPPTVPAVVGSPTATTITMSFDTAGITGSPTMAYSLGFSTSAGGTYTFLPALQQAGTVYRATVTDLTPSTAYYFKSKVSNGFTPDQISAASAAVNTAARPPAPPLKTNVVTPFLIQGPRFNDVAPWAAIDYSINVAAVGATAVLGTGNTTGQQVFATMFAGTVGDPGNVTGSTPPCQYAGSCIADMPFAALGGSGASNYSDTYLQSIQTHMGSNGRILASWGGFYADILGLFGPFVPLGFPASQQPVATLVVQSFLHNYCGITSTGNPLGWKRTNDSGNSGYQFYYDGLILDFENVGNGNPLNGYPYPPPANPPTTADLTAARYTPYLQALADIPLAYYLAAPTLFLGNAPVSLSIVSDQGQTNICAANTAFGTWFPFPTATVAPTAGTYNTKSSFALNHPEQLSYMDDIFVQFYNESQDYYPGGQYFANLMACWGFVALEAQKLGRKKTTINLGLSKGDIIPGKNSSNVYVAAGQGPTPPLDSGPPFTYWYPQYCTASPPNNTSNTAYLTWPQTSPANDPVNVAAAITAANTILRTAQNNQNIQPSDWLSGMGFWAASAATIMAQNVYTSGNSNSPGSVLPASQVYVWSDASYPAPDPQWKTGPSTFAVPIVNTL